LNRPAITALLEQTLHFLEDEGSVLLPEDKQQFYVGTVKKILEKASHPGEVLYMGIMGGTGVGKSTLIDALARAEISAISEKRPFTDRAVVYRHRNRPRGLEKISALLREVDAVHDIDIVKDFILLDLPDFDSKDENNRKNVMRIAPELDGIIWVASPEKYGDAILYEFIKRNAADQANYTFVLNKADELVDRALTDPYSNLKKILGDFTFRLKHQAGVQEPRIFSLSAAQEFRGAHDDQFLDNEFDRFRAFLISARDAKEIASVKTANLKSETRRILDELRKAVRPEQKRNLLKNIRHMELDAPISIPSGKSQPESANGLAQSVVPLLINADASIEPVRSAMRLRKLPRSRTSSYPNRKLEAEFEWISEAVINGKRGHLEKIVALMDSELLLSFPKGARASELETADELIFRAKKAAYELFLQALEKAKLSLKGFFSVWRRLWQRCVLTAPIVLLIVKLVGIGPIKQWIDHPTMPNTLTIGLTFLTSLFGSEGLIGLAVLIIFEIVFIWWLSGRRLKKIEILSQTVAESAFKYLEASFDTVFLRIRESRLAAIKRVEEGLEKLNVLIGNESV
jgi:GTP-binding protein EngB required for normal cell division